VASSALGSPVTLTISGGGGAKPTMPDEAESGEV
jgi:hypothetical protein